MRRFQNKVVVITGATRGIGLATARRLADEGAGVVVVGRQPHDVTEVAEKLGPDAIGIAADVTDTDDLARLGSQVAERVGSIDALFVNAGISRLAPVDQITEELFDQQVATNLKGAFFTVARLRPLFQGPGSIVLNGSATADRGVPGNLVYAATKAAISSMARGLSSELVGRGIRVNAIAPGAIDTELWDTIGIPGDHDQIVSGLTHSIPAKRVGRPEEIAALVAFLASDESSYLLGSTITIGGGSGTL